MAYRPDEENAVEMQITNDAFFYLRDEEEPLDPSNLEEAKEVLGMFPYGFIIRDDWKYVEGTDLVEVTFIPYIKVENETRYTHYMHMTKNQDLEFRYSDDGKSIHYRYSYAYKSPSEEKVSQIAKGQAGHAYFKTELGSTIWLHCKQIFKM